MHVNNPCHSLLISCSLVFSLPNTPLFSFSPATPPPPPPPGPRGSSAVQISVYTSGWGWRHRSALPHRLTSPQMPIYCTWQPLWSRRTSGVEYAYWKTGANLGPNKCSRAKPMKGSPSAHTDTHPQPPPPSPFSSECRSQAIIKTLEGLDFVNKNLREALRDMLELMMWLWWECLHRSCWSLHFESVTACVCVCMNTVNLQLWQSLQHEDFEKWQL